MRHKPASFMLQGPPSTREVLSQMAAGDAKFSGWGFVHVLSVNYEL